MRNPVLQAVTRRLIWVAFAAVFFYSGLYFTEWLLQPESFAGGAIRRVLAAFFPFLLPVSFLVNKKFGCASGACAADRCRVGPVGSDRQRIEIMHMPGA